MKKIGGLTWWRNNYGSMLQAYALQEWMKKYDYIDYEIICQYAKKANSFKNFREKLKKIGILKTCRRVFWRKFFKGMNKRSNEMQQFTDDFLKKSSKEYLDGKEQELNDDYDGFICGSDQIWNPTLTNFSKLYFLGFAGDDKFKMAYAPSIGVDYLDFDQKKKISEYLSSFDAISCREASGTQLINDTLKEFLIEKRAQNVLDPTLLVDKNVWDTFSSNMEKINDNYIFVYFLRGNKKQRKMIEKFAQNKKMQIVTMPFLDTEHICSYDFFFGDVKIYSGDPRDFVSLIKKAQYIFTDSFHAMVFSTIYHKEFYMIKKIGATQMNRINSYLDTFEIGNRVISEYEDINGISKIDYDKVDKILEIKRDESRSYIDEAIEKIK